MKDFPVYLFTGFLESGKTKFIQETLEDRRFCNGEKTLLLVCEEGEEEYSPDQFADSCVYIRTVFSKSELTKENLDSWAKETRAERAVIEYNGMWMLDDLYNAMPDDWAVYQEFMFADSGTFLAYNANMRQLTFDKLKSAELVVFNRFLPQMDKMEFHKVVRGASRRADIAYEDPKGNVVYDDIEDPLPFDLNAPVVEIGDEDFAVWYRDLSEEPNKYENKTVRFTCLALKRERVQLKSNTTTEIRDGSWISITAKINFRFHSAYMKKGPVLTYLSHEVRTAPDPEVATFY